MSEQREEPISVQAATDALRRAVRLEASAPEDVTPPDPRLQDEAEAEVDRLTEGGIPVSGLADLAAEVGVTHETLRLALMEIEAGMETAGEDGQTIALSRRLTPGWLTDWDLANRLRALGLERISLRREDAGSLLVFRFAEEGSARSPLNGFAGAAQRLGWPRLLASIRGGRDGASEVVFRMVVHGETAVQRRRLLGRAGFRAVLAGAVIGAPTAILSLPGAAGAGLLTCAGVWYGTMRHRTSAKVARTPLETRLKAFLLGLE